MEQENKNQSLMCPMCGSSSLSANKKGFNGTKAAIGMHFAGPLGAAMGADGMNKIEVTCLACGSNFNPGEGATSTEDLEIKKTQILERKRREQSSKDTKTFVGFALLFIICVVLYNYLSFLF